METKNDKNGLIKKGYQLLDTFPDGKKTRRQAFLRVKLIDNRKVFFSLFFDKIKFYNIRDKLRRFYFIEFLPEIFKTKKPIKIENKYIFEGEIRGKGFKIILKEISKKRRAELFLLSIYPK